MTHIDSFGRATSRVRPTSREIVNESVPHFQRIKLGYVPKIKLYSKEGGIYYLPPSVGKYKQPKEVYDIYTAEPLIMPRQKQSLDFVKKCLERGDRSVIIDSQVATGKTYQMLHLAMHLKQKTLIVVPSLLIIKNFLKERSKFVAIEVIKRQTKKEDFPIIGIILGTNLNVRYNDINGYYDLLLIDEGHSLPAKRRDQINLWKGSFIACYTGTPQRKEFSLDGFKKIFGNYFYVENPGGSEEYNLPVKVFTYRFDGKYSFEELLKSKEGISPESNEYIRRLYINKKERSMEIKNMVCFLYSIGIKKIILFTDRTEQINNLIEIIPRSFRLDGKDKSILENLPNIYCLVANVSCAGTGFNLPELECGILIMSTSWQPTIVQTAGRIRRFSGDKQFAMYIDFQDTIHIEGLKPKHLGWKERLKQYKIQGYSIHDFSSLVAI